MPRGHQFRTYRFADVLFRVSGALLAAWLYLRTLIVVPPSIDPEAWWIFAVIGAPLVLAILVAAVATTIAYMRER